MLELLKPILKGESSVFGSLLRGKKVLDMGCGRGDFLVNDPKNFIGIDINDEALEIAKSRGLRVLKGDATKAPFPDGSFDAIHCRQVIEHLFPEQAYKMLEEMDRLLQKNGKIVLATEVPNNVFWDTFSHVKPYSPRSIEKMLKQEGQETYGKLKSLEIEKVYYTGRTFRFKPFTLLATFIAHYLNIGRMNYTMILRKK